MKQSSLKSFFGGKSTKEITIKQSSIISEPLKKDESILASSTLIEEIKQTIEVKQSTNDNLPTKRPLLITEEDSTPVRKRLRKAIDIESSDKDLIDFDSTDGEQISTPIDSPSIIDSPIKESIKSLNIESKLKDEVELKIENESDDELNDEEIEDIDQIESDDEEIGKDQKKDDKDDKLSTKKLINSKIPGKSIKSSTPKPKKSKTKGSIPTSIAIAYKRSKFDPINDACWKKGEKVPYIAVARTLSEVEKTTKRLEIIEIFSRLLRSVIVLSPNDLLAVIYLCSGQIAPTMSGIELGLGDSILLKAIAESTGKSLAAVKSLFAQKGDLGTIAQEGRSKQKTMFTPKPLTVEHVYKIFHQIATESGHDSQSRKVDKIKSLLVSCREMEPMYIIRSLRGKLRIGLAGQNLLTGIAHAFILTPPNDPQNLNTSKLFGEEELQLKLNEASQILQSVYIEVPNFDEIVPNLLNYEINQLPEKCTLRPGIPSRSMLAQAGKGLQSITDRFGENQPFTCEFKYDGERTQIHRLEDGTIKIFSRNQEDSTEKFPDVIEAIKEAISTDVSTFVIDCETVAIDRPTGTLLPFQVLQSRPRKASTKEIEVNVCVFAFDLLYLNGKSHSRLPLLERRAALKNHFHEVPNKFSFAKHFEANTIEEIEPFFQESLTAKCEGLMVKILGENSIYEGKRTFNWLKIKKDYLQGMADSFDLVPIGAYFGRGKRTGVFGGFLLACYDPDTDEFQSICKIGTGFSEEQLNTFSESLKNHIIKEKPIYYRSSDNPNIVPDIWFDAVQVWEVVAADLSLSPAHKAAIGIIDDNRGVSLRFPRFIRIREDKGVKDATDSNQVAQFYRDQNLGKATEEKGNGDDW